MKRIFALVLSFAVPVQLPCAARRGYVRPQPGLSGAGTASAYIVNTDTNIIVYDKDSTKQMSAGGLTKYMTLALLLTNYADQLDNTFPDAVCHLRITFITPTTPICAPTRLFPTAKPCTPC